jgi:hypothetical protein
LNNDVIDLVHCPARLAFQADASAKP